MKSLKRFTTIIALVLAFAMLIGACGTSSGKRSSRRDDDDEEEEEEEETEEEETEDTEATEDTEETEETEDTDETEPTVDPDIEPVTSSEISYYGEVMDNIMYLASGNATEDDIWEMMGVCEFVMYNDYATSQNNLGYVLKDVNNDDIPELMIVGKFEYESEVSYSILALYTRSEEYLPTLVFEGWARNQMILLNDGSFYNCGSGGAAYTNIEVFRVNNEMSTDTLYSYFTDFEDPEDYTSDVCWYTSDNGEIELLGVVGEYEPDIPSEDDYYDLSNDFIPLANNEHHYEVVMCDCTYDEAVKKCEEMGGHLATFDSEREALTIASVISYNTEYASLFVGEPTMPDGYEDYGGNGDYYVAGISGQDGSMYVQHVSDDPIGNEPSMAGFFGFVCEYEYK